MSRTPLLLAALLLASPLLATPSVARAQGSEEEEDEAYEEGEAYEEEPDYVYVEPRQPPPPKTRPGSGVPFLVVGGVLTGLGGLNLVTSPLCKTDLVAGKDQDVCLIVQLAVGGTMVAVGVPLLIVGGVKRSEYNRWRAHDRAAAGFGIVPTPNGGFLTWRTEF